MRKLHFVCGLVLPVCALLYVGAARAQDDEARQACTPDAMRLCSDTIPDVAKTTACMKAKRAQVSKECRVAMAGGSGGGGSGRRTRHYYHHRSGH